MFLSNEDLYVIEELVGMLYHCERTSQFLQTEDPTKVNLLSTRVAFDMLLKEVPKLSSHLDADASIVHNPAFESAVVKLQMGDEQLSVEEAHAVEMFEITDNTTTSSIAASEEKLSFEEEMRCAVERQKKQQRDKGRVTALLSIYHPRPT